jgi:hypothetical protein
VDVTWQREVPEAIRSLGLSGADYSDIVTAPLPPGATPSPEQLMRDGLSVLPGALTRIVPLIHRVVLGLRVALRPSRDQPLGWSLVEGTPDHIAIEAAGPLMSARVVVHVGESHGSLATSVRYERPFAALIWGPVSLVHRRVAIALVRGAAGSAA